MEKSSAGNDLRQTAVERYADMVVRIAYHNLKNQSDAEDIAQEVFIKLLKQPGFNDDGHLKAWLIRVTVNQCRDFKKSFWQRNARPLLDEWPVFDQQQQHVLEELWKLPPDHRNVIYLHFYEGYTLAEIAKMLGKNKNTVGSWFARAKKKLKNLLTEGDVYHE